MFIPNEQVEKETPPIAYRVTIWLMSDRSATNKNSLENFPDQEQRKFIKQTVEDKIIFYGNHLLALNLCKRRLELIIEAPAETKKIISRLTICIIEILKKSDRFSEKINLWQPETKVHNICTQQNLQNAVRSIKNEKELALRKTA